MANLKRKIKSPFRKISSDPDVLYTVQIPGLGPSNVRDLGEALRILKAGKRWDPKSSLSAKAYPKNMDLKANK